MSNELAIRFEKSLKFLEPTSLTVATLESLEKNLESMQIAKQNCEKVLKSFKPFENTKKERQDLGVRIMNMAISLRYSSFNKASKELKDLHIETWVRILSKLDKQDVFNALDWWLENKPDYPTPAEIKEIVEKKGRIGIAKKSLQKIDFYIEEALNPRLEEQKREEEIKKQKETEEYQKKVEKLFSGIKNLTKTKGV